MAEPRAVVSTSVQVRRLARWMIEICRWYGHRLVPFATRETYSDAFWTFHEAGDWTGFARELLHAFRPTVVVDVGCGDAKLLAAIREIAPDVSVMGFDGSGAALQRAVARGVPIEETDLAQPALSPRLVASLERCSLALCLETAEHLPPWRGRGLVRALAHAPIVVFSAAQPGQGGRLHVNERPPEYWAHLFASEGLTPHPLQDALRARIHALHLPAWYAANLQVLTRT